MAGHPLIQHLGELVKYEVDLIAFAGDEPRVEGKR